MDTIVVFIENQQRYHYNLVKSLSILNIPYKRLHEGGEWNGMWDKIQVYIDGLLSIDNEWVILSDSRDVLFYKGIEEINKIYQTHYSDSDIVIQAEDSKEGDVFFRQKNMERYVLGTGYYKYLCAGLMMGKRTTIINFFKDILENVADEWKFKTTDQPAVEWGMKHLGYNIVLDSDCRIFQHMGMGSDSGMNYHLHFNKNFIKNTYTNTEPCIFHGAGKSFLEPVWKIINKKY